MTSGQSLVSEYQKLEEGKAGGGEVLLKDGEKGMFG